MSSPVRSDDLSEIATRDTAAAWQLIGLIESDETIQRVIRCKRCRTLFEVRYWMSFSTIYCRPCATDIHYQKRLADQARRNEKRRKEWR